MANLDPEEVAEEVDESAGHRHHREEEGVAEVGVLGPSPHLHTVQYSTVQYITLQYSTKRICRNPEMGGLK